jgi:hypothetical protein
MSGPHSDRQSLLRRQDLVDQIEHDDCRKLGKAVGCSMGQDRCDDAVRSHPQQSESNARDTCDYRRDDDEFRYLPGGVFLPCLPARDNVLQPECDG